MEIVPTRRERLLRITETRQGRVIEAWVSEPILLEEPESVPERMAWWVVPSMGLWGLFGIGLGTWIVETFWR